MRENPRQKANFASRFIMLRRFKSRGEKYIASVFQKNMIVFVRPVSTGGALRDRHGRGKRDAMDAAARETNAPTRTAKSCGPDPPTLGSSLR
jgi:hypothetical protein